MRFIVAVDGSAESDRALEHAGRVVDPDRDSLTLVHVVNPDVYADTRSSPLASVSDADDVLVATVADAEERGGEVLEDALETTGEMGVPADTELLYGNPATELSRFAREESFDGIFVGHRGMTERAERVLGSVAKDLVERADCPVTVVR